MSPCVIVDPAAAAADSDRSSSARPGCGNRRSQAWEVAMLTLMGVLQVSNAEMLRRVSGSGLKLAAALGDRSLVARAAFVLADRVHPVAMLATGTWRARLALTLLRGRSLPR